MLESFGDLHPEFKNAISEHEKKFKRIFAESKTLDKACLAVIAFEMEKEYELFRSAERRVKIFGPKMYAGIDDLIMAMDMAEIHPYNILEMAITARPKHRLFTSTEQVSPEELGKGTSELAEPQDFRVAGKVVLMEVFKILNQPENRNRMLEVSMNARILKNPSYERILKIKNLEQYFRGEYATVLDRYFRAEWGIGKDQEEFTAKVQEVVGHVLHQIALLDVADIEPKKVPEYFRSNVKNFLQRHVSI
jgi:hypothetical protein